LLTDKLLRLDIGLLRDNDCHDQVDQRDAAEACEERQQSQQADDDLKIKTTKTICFDLTMK